MDGKQDTEVVTDENETVPPLSSGSPDETDDLTFIPPDLADEKDLTEEEKKKKKIRKIIGTVLFIIFNAVVLFFTARDDFSQKTPKFQGEPFSGKNIAFLACSLLCFVLVLAIETVKYLLMMRHLGEKVSVRNAFETAALGKYYDCITPSGAGGQPFQIWNLMSHGYSNGASSAMPLTSFVTMQFGFVILALAMMIFSGVDTATGIRIAAYVGVFMYTIVPAMIVWSAISPKTSFAVVKFFVKIGAKIHIFKDPEKTLRKAEENLTNYSNNLKSIAKKPFLIITLLLLSILYQAALCSIPYFVICTFGANIGFFESLAIVMYVYASITLIPTPGNSGAAEGSFYILFSRLETSSLFWAMVVWRFLVFYLFIIVGLGIYGFRALEKLLKRRKA